MTSIPSPQDPDTRPSYKSPNTRPSRNLVLEEHMAVLNPFKEETKNYKNQNQKKVPRSKLYLLKTWRSRKVMVQWATVQKITERKRRYQVQVPHLLALYYSQLRSKQVKREEKKGALQSQKTPPRAPWDPEKESRSARIVLGLLVSMTKTVLLASR